MLKFWLLLILLGVVAVVLLGVLFVLVTKRDKRPVVKQEVKEEVKPVEEVKIVEEEKPVEEVKEVEETPQVEEKPQEIVNEEAVEVKEAVEKPERKRNYHVSLHDDGSWQVKREGASRVLRKFETQQEAIAFAKEKAANQGINVVIHKADGKIRKQKYDSKEEK